MTLRKQRFRMAIITALIGISLTASAQHSGGGTIITGRRLDRRGGKVVPPKTVAFDPKSKLNVAYAKIIDGANQTFEKRLEAAVVMERWEAVDEVLSELEPARKRDVGITTLGKAGAKIAIPMNAILTILDDCPGPMTSQQKATVLALLKKTISAFGGVDQLVKKIEIGFLGLGGTEYQGKKEAFELLMKLELYDNATEFLITTDDAKKADKDAVVLQHFKALSAKCRKVGRTADYLRLREIGQWLLDRKKIPAYELAKITTEMTPTLGFIDEKEAIAWFQENFKQGPVAEKKTVLACTDYLAKARLSKNSALRDAGLRLQKRMVDALILTNELKDRGPVADILAGYWLEEAKRGEQKVQEKNRHDQRYQWQRRYGRSYPAVKYSDAGAPSMAVLSETIPSGVWVKKLRPASFLKLQEYRSNIYVNTDQFESAIEVVKQVAKIAPGKAASMAEGLLKKWSAKVNPNAGLSQNASYAGKRGIPLTRTKQLRNMQQLKTIVAEFRGCLAGELKETILVNAFTNAHSAAEVYRLSDIEAVLGDPAKLSRDAVWALASTMRQKLNKSWNKEDLQKALATKRTKRELEDMLVGGYGVLTEFMERSIAGQKYPTRLYALYGVILFEYFEFKYNLDRQEKDKIKACFEIRDRAYANFNKSVESYAEYLKTNPDAPYSTQIHEIWFDTITNASSTNTVEGKAGVGTDNLDAIKASFDMLPKNVIQAHRDMFAATLLDKALKAPGDKKIAFMEAGLHICKNGPLAPEFQRHLEYYQELLTEVKLLVRVDGSKRIGTRPFGIFISLIHTSELAREAGGFSQYLNSQMRNPLNPRAPAFNPLQKFTDNVTNAVDANYEVLGVTFCAPSVKPRRFDVTKWTGDALLAGRWQETPLAYVTLKAKDEAVDSIPAMHMDLHFVDLNSGVAIPVRSRVIHGIKATDVDPRPCPNLKITQILDQRNLNKDGRVTLEIKAVAAGVIPELDRVLTVPELKSFERSIADDGLQVRSLESKERVSPSVERSWTISYTLKKVRSETLPKQFVLPAPVVAEAEIENKVYDDANLEKVDTAVALVWGEDKPVDYVLWAIVGIIAILLVIVGFVAVLRKPSGEQVEERRFVLPDKLTPFTAIQFLEDIIAHARLDDDVRTEAKHDRDALVKTYFGQTGEGELDSGAMRNIAGKWIDKVG